MDFDVNQGCIPIIKRDPLAKEGDRSLFEGYTVTMVRLQSTIRKGETEKNDTLFNESLAELIKIVEANLKRIRELAGDKIPLTPIFETTDLDEKVTNFYGSIELMREKLNIKGAVTLLSKVIAIHQYKGDVDHPGSQRYVLFASIVEKVKRTIGEAKSAKFRQDIKLVEDWVSCFLHPYINGKITKESESPNRKPMMELLLEKFGDIDTAKQKKLEELALDVYLEKAAMGLYINRKRGALQGDITPDSEVFKLLINALREALPKDFPNKLIPTEVLQKKAAEALVSTNKIRAHAKKEAFNFQITGNNRVRFEKFRELDKTKKLFLEKK